MSIKINNKEKYSTSSISVDDVFGKINSKSKLIPIYLIKCANNENKLTAAPKWGMQGKNAGIAQYIFNKYKGNDGILNNIWAINRIEHINIKEVIDNDISESTEIKIVDDLFHSVTNGRGKWETIIDALIGNRDGCSSHMTDYKLIANYMHLILIDSSNTPTILFSLTAINEITKDYIGLTNISGKEPDPKYFRFFIHPLVDSKDSPWPSIRTNYRKHIKPLIKDVKIIECDNIQSVICDINNVITGGSVKEINANLDKFSEKFFKELKETTANANYTKKLEELSVIK